MPVHFPDGVRVNRLCYSQVQALASWASKGIPARTRATVAGQIYYVSAWIRIDSQQQTATWGGIRVQVQDANWNNLNNVVLTPATSPYGQWTRVQFSFVAAGTSSRLSAGPFTDGLYTVSMDDFVVSASPVAGAPTHGGDKVLAKPAVSAPQQQGGGAISTRNYYFFNGARIAMSRDPRSVNRNGERDRGRQCSGTCSAANPGTVTWLHSDPLGSATLATNASGQPLVGSETRYSPFGSVRFGGAGLPHDRRFNGNKTDIAGLLDFGARAYDPLIGRFISADTIVPNPADPQSFNRYTYGLSNPLRYTDPSGHDAEDAIAFLVGVAYGWAKANRDAIPIPSSASERQLMQNAESLAVTHPSFTEGRIAGGVIAAVQDVIEAGAGGTAAGGGVVACATGVGCVAGAPAMAIGAVEIYHGAATALSGAGDAASQLALFAKGSDWSVGEPINQGNPSWEVARSRYWRNRAQNAGGEFSRQNIGLMKRGFAPKASVRVRHRSSGVEDIITVEKELHHINGRNIPDPHDPSNLMEVWPWEHEALDPSRNTGYDFLGFK